MPSLYPFFSYLGHFYSSEEDRCRKTQDRVHLVGMNVNCEVGKLFVGNQSDRTDVRRRCTAMPKQNDVFALLLALRRPSTAKSTQSLRTISVIHQQLIISII